LLRRVPLFGRAHAFCCAEIAEGVKPYPEPKRHLVAVSAFRRADKPKQSKPKNPRSIDVRKAHLPVIRVADINH
jgi:hypothetical protein